MRLLIFLFLALSAGFALTKLSDNPGYILISRQPWSFETSLLVFSIALLAIFLLFYLFLRLLDNVLSTPARLKRWQQQRNQIQAVEATRKGLVELILGHKPQAERLLNRNISDSPQADINLLACAWISQKNDNTDSRDDYLDQARQLAGGEHGDVNLTAINLFNCHLLEQTGDTDKALSLARELHQKTPANTEILNILTHLLEHDNQWQELLDTLVKSSRYKAISEDEILRLQILASCNLISAHPKTQDNESSWKALPKKLRKHPKVIATYSLRLAESGQHKEAESLIRTALKREWSDELIEVYGRLATDKPTEQLKQAESWLISHPTESPLMLCMGRLAIKSQLWGMARSYLEMAAQNGDSHQATLELGWLYESLGESDAAISTYKSGLENSLCSPSQDYTISQLPQADDNEEVIIAPTADSVKMPHSPSLAYTNESK